MNIIYLLKGNDLAWRGRAACANYGHLFFPTRGEAVEGAKAICEGCPVRGKCLSLGLMEPFGIWGGMTLRQRRILRRAVKKGVSLRKAVEKLLHEKAPWVDADESDVRMKNIS